MTLDQHKNRKLRHNRLFEEINNRLTDRVPGSGLLISRLPGSALRTHLESFGKSLAMSTSVLKALLGKLDIKRHSPSILYISASFPMSTSVLKAWPG